MSDTGIRSYRPDEVVTFRKTSEEFGGLSNMAPGFPIFVVGFRFRTSEALYQACRFPHLPEIQAMILEEGSPMTAKMRSKPFRRDSRPDWEDVRVPIMRWCLRLKLLENWHDFSSLLLATGERAIVEDSRKDRYWGAVKRMDAQLEGQNVLGRLLMELRDKLRSAPSNLNVVAPPKIDRFEIMGKTIGVIEGASLERSSCSEAIDCAHAAPRKQTSFL